MKNRILIVEDEGIVARYIADRLERLGYYVPTTVSSGTEAITAAKTEKPDLILMDIMIEGELDGVDTANIIRDKFGIPIIFLTAYSDSKTLSRAKVTSPYGYILKPFNERELHITIEIALEKRKMERKLEESQNRFKQIVELSPDGIFVQQLTKENLFEIVFLNEAGVNLFHGNTKEEFLGRSLRDFYISGTMPKSLGSDNRDDNSDINKHSEAVFRCFDGSFIVVEMTEIPFIYKESPSIQVILRDVTLQRKLEHDLEENEKELRLKVDIYQKDMNAAKLIQNEMILKNISSCSWLDIDYRYFPVEEIGGDFFSITSLDQSHIGIFIGDVANHGVRAALFLALIKATYDRIISKHGKSAYDVIKLLNDNLINHMPHSFLTGQYGVFMKDDEGNLSLTLSNGGHPPAILIRANGEGSFFSVEGDLLGVFEEGHYKEETISVYQGDRIFFYTDGLTEIENTAGKLLGYEGLMLLLQESRRNSISDTMDELVKMFREYNPNIRISDDIVLIGVEVLSEV